MSFSLVYWIITDQTSIVPCNAVYDKRMLTDSERSGKVKWMGPDDAKKKPLKEGWSSHDVRILFVSGECFLLLIFYLLVRVIMLHRTQKILFELFNCRLLLV